MNVLYIVTAYPRWPGDVITPWLVETIRRLGERGIGVEVLAPAYRGATDPEVEGVRVHRFRYAPAGWETLTHDQTAPDRVRERPWYLGLLPSYVTAGAWAAAGLARSGRFQLVHAFWPLPHGLFGMAAKRAGDIPLVTTFFGVELSWVESELRPLRPLVRGIVRGSDAVTTISSHTEAELRRLVPGVRPHRIPFGAAVEVGPAGDAPRGDAGRETAAPGSPYRLLFVGRLVERKGVGVLLQALGRVRERHAVELTVVGEGPLRGELERRAERLGLGESVAFTGAIGPEALAERFRACDALVLPAVRDAKGDVEGLGVVLIEALSSGKPVVASASGGIVDIVRHEETGLLVPEADPGALADAIVRYIEDPALAQRLAEAGRVHVAREFSWDAVGGRLEELYRSLVSR